LHVRINMPRFLESARPASYAMVNSFLAQHWALSTTLQMRPAKLLVFLTIVAATVQRTMRQDALPDELRGLATMSRDFINYSTRRAIAEATGMPRENVRRLIDELMKDGLLITDARGRIANKGQILARPGVVAALQTLLEEQAKVAEVLLATAALEVVPAAPPA
jgi:biotin operon repressor